MPRMIEAEARISAIDATGRTFEDISRKVKGLQSAFKSLQGITSSGVGRVNKTIGTLHNTMRTLKPAAEAAGGAGGLHGIRGLIHETVKATAEQAHEAVRMSVSGMSESEIAEAEKLSGELSERYRSLSKTTIMHSLRNMRAIVGTYEEAAKILDPVLKLRVAAQGAHPEHAEELEADFDKLVKGMEIKGVTMDPEKFRSYMQGMAKAINVFGDTLRPTDYYEMFKYGRQSTQSLSEKFMLETAPTLAQELGGSSAGKAMSSFYQAIVGGRVKKSAIEEMLDVGLIGDESKILRTTTGAVKGMLPGAVKNWQLAASDPYAWVNEVALPAFKAKGITEPDEIQAHLGTMFQAATAAQMAGIFATQQARIQKDWALVHGAKGLEATDTFQAKDPFIAWSGMTEQFKNLLAIAGGPLAQPAADGLNAIASGIAALEKAATDHPDIAATSLLGGASLGTAASAYLGYRGLKGIRNWFGGGAPAAAEEAALAAEGSSFLGTVLAGTRFGAPGAFISDSMMRDGIYGGGPEVLDAVRNHKLRSYFRSQFGMPEPTATEPPPADKQAGFSPFNTWQPAAAYAAGVPAPEVKGSAELKVDVQVEPSDSFISRIVQAVRNEINVFGPSPGSGAGTAGSTGLSMPEAGPQP